MLRANDCDDGMMRISGMLSEYLNVLRRPRFAFSEAQIERIINGFLLCGSAIEQTKASIFPLPDESDRKFYDLAKGSDAFLISGNTRHFPAEPFILTPTDFLLGYYRKR